MFKRTTATDKIFSMRGRIRAVAGGTSASKTISIIFWLIDFAQSRKNKKIWVVSESFPHLKLGAMQDFKDIMHSQNYWQDKLWNATESTYTFETGSIIKFTSVDTYGKAHGPRRDILYLNECNNLDYNIVDQLITRTRDTVWMDWNPSSEFWFYDKMLGKRNDLEFITLTYKDNEALDELTIREIESHKDNKNWWQVYGLGQLGEIEGRIYTGWRIIDEIPFEARLEGYGLDFGYSNDPTAIVAVYYYNGGYILDEVCYRKGLHNSEISNILKALPYGLVVADSAEPKSIDEISQYGISIISATKGAGSISWGIGQVQEQKISVTKNSVNLLKEYRGYLWKTDKSGNIINKPEAGNDHALDAVRYKITSLKPRSDDTDISKTTGNLSGLWGV
ncbi:MAG: phage terminase large subunit [Candidatus Saccharibacteria bacterium]|nr:phage terminase large subunit [Candidatus Saccharibacteria bacterium]